MKTEKFPTVHGISRWSDGMVWYLDGDENLPYTVRLGHFYYFSKQEQDFVLVMESYRDLQECMK